ncbi:uncharacterized protein EI97DRAFT_495863 [Westerdykella ornata]|uniref:Elongator complex protein 5 n=1 Tax=Westerdykella ornata TaxID=318751 RepID=A0A6A6JB91_WESOR|nr:uncharacterized protein EI97DRAFT_495863 [Westerdykella ornata]KAF2273692.1 hypothetical protein EI97DRAFT_495863 [Westerdykella ornata]
MSSYSRIPPLLQPHTRLPTDDSILLVTSTLGASANWLIIRFLCEALGRDRTVQGAADDGAVPSEGKEDVAVVLVSWLRDWGFWKNEARKGGGLDLERLKRDKRLAFVDGLTKMCLADLHEGKPESAQTPIERFQGPHQRTPLPTGRAQPTVLPVRGPPGRINARIPGPTAGTSIADPASMSSIHQGPVAQFYITSPTLKDVRSAIEGAIRHVESTGTQRKTLLILDTPSFLLASNPDITTYALSAEVLHLHKFTSHILVHVPADDALISLSEPSQPIEVEGNNFLVKMAHMSTRILSCRVLDTGYAKDVSGVLRITENASARTLDLLNTERDGDERRGRELLYLVKGDGSVKMFERGAGGDI